MPLDAEAERQVGGLDGFDNAIGRVGGRRKAASDDLDGLVMPAVDLRRHPGRHGAREVRAGDDLEAVRHRRERVGHGVGQRDGHLRWQILDQRAARRDVEDLHAPADGQQRQALAQAAVRHLDLEGVARLLGERAGRVHRLAVQGGVDVGAAGEHDAVGAVQRRSDVADGQRPPAPRHRRRRAT